MERRLLLIEVKVSPLHGCEVCNSVNVPTRQQDIHLLIKILPSDLNLWIMTFYSRQNLTDPRSVTADISGDVRLNFRVLLFSSSSDQSLWRCVMRPACAPRLVLFMLNGNTGSTRGDFTWASLLAAYKANALFKQIPSDSFVTTGFSLKSSSRGGLDAGWKRQNPQSFGNNFDSFLSLCLLESFPCLLALLLFA